ncbi:YihY/virulence factor BrkB family protein [Butyrivibrio sp.]|uniref:YihY/virulence factor BrkB family protein n=1 Tax=Butyrivibrio sp. TaxID=28121 RepID=UPI0025BC42B7|nr:YihY/virulence factor BrkB family protein [Butyrivibrio sp.]
MNVKAALVAVVMDFATKMQKKNIAAFASSAAFFLILSIIPLLLLITSILPYTTVTEEDLIRAFVQTTPDFANDIMIRLVDEAYMQSTAILSFTAVITIWAGSLGMLALIRGLNCIYDIDERRNYFYLRLIASAYTVVMIIIMFLMLVLMVFGNLIEGFFIKMYSPASYIFTFLVNFRFILVIGIAFLMFALIYTYVPSGKFKFVYQLPGAVFSAVVWYVFSWIFSIYVEKTDNYSLYGSLATPVIMMFWLYSCMYIFFIGAFINRFFHPAVKVLYQDHHKKTVRKNAKRKSTKRLRKPGKFNEFG